ncbi:hypothetical protein NDU88_002191 [Pleurodeles waltl]|uniref:Uncharacterized protein n=1 Tax=Pleurodeles waltl TaxID=8319 RepID=A0AAV7T1I9_PLEWA|nr:hypothetical protein NDU88_002191 [Pleurodeles waltl]
MINMELLNEKRKQVPKKREHAQSKYVDERKSRERNVEVGDRVRIRLPGIIVKGSSKFSVPKRVVEVKSPDIHPGTILLYTYLCQHELKQPIVSRVLLVNGPKERGKERIELYDSEATPSVYVFRPPSQCLPWPEEESWENTAWAEPPRTHIGAKPSEPRPVAYCLSAACHHGQVAIVAH